MKFKSDIEIARSAQKIPIADVAKKLDISYDDIVPYGNDKAKISDKFLKKLSSLIDINPIGGKVDFT